MSFAEKLKELRAENGLTQSEVSSMIGIGIRAYKRYESGESFPRSRETYQLLADALKCDVNYLLTEDQIFVTDAEAKYGYRGKKQAEALVEQIAGLFAGGELTEADRDAVMEAITEAYFDSKQKNRKYVPKKYRE